MNFLAKHQKTTVTVFVAILLISILFLVLGFALNTGAGGTYFGHWVAKIIIDEDNKIVSSSLVPTSILSRGWVAFLMFPICLPMIAFNLFISWKLITNGAFDFNSKMFKTSLVFSFLTFVLGISALACNVQLSDSAWLASEELSLLRSQINTGGQLNTLLRGGIYP